MDVLREQRAPRKCRGRPFVRAAVSVRHSHSEVIRKFAEEDGEILLGCGRHDVGMRLAVAGNLDLEAVVFVTGRDMELHVAAT